MQSAPIILKKPRWKIRKSKKDINKNIAAINQKYTDLSIQGKNKIKNCINQWDTIKSNVYQFNNQPIRDIIA